MPDHEEADSGLNDLNDVFTVLKTITSCHVLHFYKLTARCALCSLQELFVAQPYWQR